MCHCFIVAASGGIYMQRDVGAYGLDVGAAA